jgi:hypothetical protein
VASRNLRNTSSSHIETAAASRSCKGRCGGAHVFPRARGRAGGRQAKELLGWIASSMTISQHLAKTFPAKSISTVKGHTGLLHLSRPATFGTLRILTSRLRKWAEAAKCGVGRVTIFSEPRAERGEGKRRSCWAGSHPPSRPITPRQKISRERHFDCPGPHGTAGLVASRSLRNTSNSHVETAAAGRSCKGRCGGAHVFPRAWGRAGGRQAKELLGWIASSMTISQHLARTFPAKSISTVQGHTGLLHLWPPGTFGILRVYTYTSRLRQWPEAASKAC